MTVRWKPLLVLSGLFVMIAVLGLLTIFYALNTGAAELVTQAKAAQAAGQFEEARIHYRRALQREANNASIYEDLSNLYGEWLPTAAPDKRKELLREQFEALTKAATHDKTLAEPRAKLLAFALRNGDAQEATRWARELIRLKPEHADAHYALGHAGLDANPPALEEVKTSVEFLRSKEPNHARTQWLSLRFAQLTGKEPFPDDILLRSRSLDPPDNADLVDRMDLLKLRTMDLKGVNEPRLLLERIPLFLAAARGVASENELAVFQIHQFYVSVEDLQRRITWLTRTANDQEKKQLEEAGVAMDKVCVEVFDRALNDPAGPEFRVYLVYAEHLLFHRKHEECLKLIDDALKSPQASNSLLQSAVLTLKETAVKAALSQGESERNFAVAEPYVKDLMNSSDERFQGLGCLYQGAMELERCGIANVKAENAPTAEETQRLRDSALRNLKKAAELLPKRSSAQALYGIALIQMRELGLGRQYLQKARTLGALESRYQLWAAWSLVQGGYPEDAEGIAKALQEGVDNGSLPRTLLGNIRLLQGEIAQAKRSPEQLRAALRLYEDAIKQGQPLTPSLQLRMAQIRIMLGETDQGMKMINSLSSQGEGNASAENLAILALVERKDFAGARTRLAAARTKFPENGELIALDSALHVQAGEFDKADAVLQEFLKTHPDDFAIIQTRAQLLATRKNQPDEARKLLSSAADRSPSTSPMSQLAMLEMSLGNMDAAMQVVSRMRTRWPESSAADLLATQIAMSRGDLEGASDFLATVLAKDPSNKLALYWKAKIDSDLGESGEETSAALEELARGGSVKEVQPNLTLSAAAENTLAELAASRGNFDEAIQRIQDLLDSSRSAQMSRDMRWKLVNLYSLKSQWDLAKKEIAGLLNDPKSPPTAMERVRAANYFRTHRELDTAQRLLAPVIAAKPAPESAVVIQALTLHDLKRDADAAKILRETIDQLLAAKKKPLTDMFLMLGAMENISEPKASQASRSIAVLDQGLVSYPYDLSLIEGKYRVLRTSSGKEAAAEFVASIVKSAVANVESLPNGNPLAYYRFLINVYAEQEQIGKALDVVAQARTARPDDPAFAVLQLRLSGAQALAAAKSGDEATARTLLDKTLSGTKEIRAKFPNQLELIEIEAELALMRNDDEQAIVLSRQIDNLSKTSENGAMIRARIAHSRNRPHDVAAALKEALDRKPRRIDIRAQLGQTLLSLGEFEEVIKHSDWILERLPLDSRGVLLKARALAEQTGVPSRMAERRTQAVNLLSQAIAKNPKNTEFYAQYARIAMMSNQRTTAIGALRQGLNAVPGNPLMLGMQIQLMCEPRGPKQPASPAEIEEAKSVARQAAETDKVGEICLAVALGFSRSDQLDTAIPYAARAAQLSNAPQARLNHGALLLAKGESLQDPAVARTMFEKANVEYDQVLAADANNAEAVNNKAWILHSYLGEHQKALDVAEGFLKRSRPADLPSEFFDTLGAIQESLGNLQGAEKAYAQGLAVAPDEPRLNYRLGCLIAKDPVRKASAINYFRKAQAGARFLKPEMVADLNKQLSSNTP